MDEITEKITGKLIDLGYGTTVNDGGFIDGGPFWWVNATETTLSVVAHDSWRLFFTDHERAINVVFGLKPKLSDDLLQLSCAFLPEYRCVTPEQQRRFDFEMDFWCALTERYGVDWGDWLYEMVYEYIPGL